MPFVRDTFLLKPAVGVQKEVSFEEGKVLKCAKNKRYCIGSRQVFVFYCYLEELRPKDGEPKWRHSHWRVMRANKASFGIGV